MQMMLQKICLQKQCLVHYTYASSNQQLMLLDVQGSGYCLCDPEIATNVLMDGLWVIRPFNFQFKLKIEN